MGIPESRILGLLLGVPGLELREDASTCRSAGSSQPTLQPPVVWLREAKGLAVAAQLLRSRTDTHMRVFWGAVEYKS